MIGEFSTGMLIELDTGQTWASADEWARDPDDWFLRTCIEFGLTPPWGPPVERQSND